jgi:hypothetical protein
LVNSRAVFPIYPPLRDFRFSILDFGFPTPDNGILWGATGSASAVLRQATAERVAPNLAKSTSRATTAWDGRTSLVMPAIMPCTPVHVKGKSGPRKGLRIRDWSTEPGRAGRGNGAAIHASSDWAGIRCFSSFILHPFPSRLACGFNVTTTRVRLQTRIVPTEVRNAEIGNGQGAARIGVRGYRRARYGIHCGAGFAGSRESPNATGISPAGVRSRTMTRTGGRAAHGTRRDHGCTGCPLGRTTFVERLEQVVGRVLRPRKPGRPSKLLKQL